MNCVWVCFQLAIGNIKKDYGQTLAHKIVENIVGSRRFSRTDNAQTWIMWEVLLFTCWLLFGRSISNVSDETPPQRRPLERVMATK